MRERSTIMSLSQRFPFQPALKEVERARPHKPDGPREERTDDAQRLLECLREVGAAGITTGELIRDGRFGLRPPNRVMDLRKAGHLIETIREGNGAFRYRLIRENPDPQPPRSRSKTTEQTTLSSSGDWYERQHGPRPSGKPEDDVPLFASRGMAS